MRHSFFEEKTFFWLFLTFNGKVSAFRQNISAGFSRVLCTCPQEHFSRKEVFLRKTICFIFFEKFSGFLSEIFQGRSTPIYVSIEKFGGNVFSSGKKVFLYRFWVSFKLSDIEQNFFSFQSKCFWWVLRTAVYVSAETFSGKTTSYCFFHPFGVLSKKFMTTCQIFLVVG